MAADDDIAGQAARIDPDVRPDWLATGFKFFPYAARQGDHWWVLRLNCDFPEHDLYTVFVDGKATADVSGSQYSPLPLVASVGVLRPFAAVPTEPAMNQEEAQAVVRPCTPFVVYGSEIGDPCDWCEHLARADPLERLSRT